MTLAHTQFYGAIFPTLLYSTAHLRAAMSDATEHREIELCVFVALSCFFSSPACIHKYVCKSNNPYLISAPRRAFVCAVPFCHTFIAAITHHARRCSSGCIARNIKSAHALARETTLEITFSHLALGARACDVLHQRVRSTAQIIECELLRGTCKLVLYYTQYLVENMRSIHFCSQRAQLSNWSGNFFKRRRQETGLDDWLNYQYNLIINFDHWI